MGQGQSTSARNSQNFGQLNIDSSDTYISEFSSNRKIIPVSEYIKRDKRSKNFQKASNTRQNEIQSEENTVIDKTESKTVQKVLPNEQNKKPNLIQAKQSNISYNLNQVHDSPVREIYRNVSFEDLKSNKLKTKKKDSSKKKSFKNDEIRNEEDTDILSDTNERSTHQSFRHDYGRKIEKGKTSIKKKNLVMQTSLSCSIYPTNPSLSIVDKKTHPEPDSYKFKIQTNQLKILPEEIHEKYGALVNELQDRTDSLEKSPYTITEIMKAPNIKTYEYNYSNISKPVSFTRLQKVHEEHRKFISPKYALENWKNIHTLKHHRFYKNSKTKNLHITTTIDRNLNKFDTTERNFGNSATLPINKNSDYFNSALAELTKKKLFENSMRNNEQNSSNNVFCKYVRGRKSTWVQDKHLNWHKIILDQEDYGKPL